MFREVADTVSLQNLQRARGVFLPIPAATAATDSKFNHRLLFGLPVAVMVGVVEEMMCAELIGVVRSVGRMSGSGEEKGMCFEVELEFSLFITCVKKSNNFMNG